MQSRKSEAGNNIARPEQKHSLIWLKAAYGFHTFAYRDPRAAFASATGCPVVSPTTVLLGIVSTLFSLGKDKEAKKFLTIAPQCRVIVDSPEGIIFFRAFHQLRRYETGAMKVKKEKFKPNAKIGLTKINQGTREYGLVDGLITIIIGVPEPYLRSIRLSLLNMRHLGTHDSMCTLAGKVETCTEPEDVVYLSPEEWRSSIPPGATVVTLSRFKDALIKPTLPHWWMAGGDNTERVPFFIKGRFEGTARGKIYRKH